MRRPAMLFTWREPLLAGLLAVMLVLALVLALGAPAGGLGEGAGAQERGEPRKVEMERLRGKIGSGRLSDRPALFYERVP